MRPIIATSGWDLLTFLYTRETLQDYLGNTNMTLPFKPQWKYPMAKLVTNFTPSYMEYLDLLDQESPSPVIGRQALGRNLALPLRQAISGERSRCGDDAGNRAGGTHRGLVSERFAKLVLTGRTVGSVGPHETCAQPAPADSVGSHRTWAQSAPACHVAEHERR